MDTRPRVLVPEAHDVTQLMNNDAELVAVFADRNRLRTVTAFSHKRTATKKRVFFNFCEFYHKLISSHRQTSADISNQIKNGKFINQIR